jgi:alanyl-tRNA synthetase
MATPQTGDQIRRAFLEFFEARNHRILPSSSLIPEDTTVLLTIAGMLQFKPIFLGQRQAEVPRATTSQKCIRTNDIENVGRTARHHTFFEMLGNFSFGDYFKPEAIAWAWELSTQVFALPADRLVVSVFREDDEAYGIWRDQIGVPEARIRRMDEKDNFWESGPTGPCGPCSEIYYDFKPELGDADIDLEDDSRFIEFYNLVFMQYNKDKDGTLTPLQAQNIDTGLGLERMAQILQGKPNNYETDLIFPIIDCAAAIANLPYATCDERLKTSYKVVGDHIRSVAHLIADGVTAANGGRGYILRRLIRRVVRHGRLLGINRPFTVEVVESAIALMEAVYPNLREREAQIKAELGREEAQFLKTIDRGEQLLTEILAKLAPGEAISGADAFMLYDQEGFPLELTQEIAEETGVAVDVEGFNLRMEKQRSDAKAAAKKIDLTVQAELQILAQTLEATRFFGYDQPLGLAQVVAIFAEGRSVATAEAGQLVQLILDQTPFYGESGGQVGDRGYLLAESLIVRITDVQKESGLFVHFGEVERGLAQVGDRVTAQVDLACRRRSQANHSATHLLQAALKAIVDPTIGQAGSLVSFDRLRFDFNLNRGLTAVELQQVEDQINSWISEAHGASVAEMPIAEAKTKGAVAMFGEKYGDVVRVVDFGGVSMELCGGTHVTNTAEIGVFKIIAETGTADGIRRIEAVSGPAILDYLNVRDAVVRDLGNRFKVKPEEIADRVTGLQAELKASYKQIEALKGDLAIAKSDSLLGKAETIGTAQVILAQLDGVEGAALQTAAERLQQRLGDGGAIVLGSATEGKVTIVVAFGPAVIAKGLQAGKFIGPIAKICGGGGGGKPALAQAGGRDAAKLPEALAEAKAQLENLLR